MAEILVAIALIAILVAVVGVAVLGRLRSAQGSALATNLRALSEAVWSFRGDMGRFPRRLVQLTAKPALGDLDLCSRPMPNVDSWEGPYLQQSVGATGLTSGDALVLDTLTRDPPTVSGGKFATLLVTATSVDSTVAADLELAFDGTPPDFVAGTIRWVPAGLGTLSYAIPIRGC